MKIEDMTLRDYFAAKASEEDIKAQAEVIRSSSTLGILPDGWLAVARYMHADAMLAARGQEKTNQCGETCERAKLCAVCAAPLEQATPDQDGPGEEDGPWAEGWEQRSGFPSQARINNEILTEIRKQRDELLEVFQLVISEMTHRDMLDGNAPGHSHEIPGVWDSDNGELAGMNCAWCAVWKKAKELCATNGRTKGGAA